VKYLHLVTNRSLYSPEYLSTNGPWVMTPSPDRARVFGSKGEAKRAVRRMGAIAAVDCVVNSLIAPRRRKK
jgi:hypothetical protein